MERLCHDASNRWSVAGAAVDDECLVFCDDAYGMSVLVRGEEDKGTNWGNNGKKVAE